MSKIDDIPVSLGTVSGCISQVGSDISSVGLDFYGASDRNMDEHHGSLRGAKCDILDTTIICLRYRNFRSSRMRITAAFTTVNIRNSAYSSIEESAANSQLPLSPREAIVNKRTFQLTAMTLRALRIEMDYNRDTLRASRILGMSISYREISR